MEKIGLQIIDYDYPFLVDFLATESLKRKILLTYYNFNTLILFNKNPQFFDDLKNQFYIHGDGIGTYLFSKFIFGFSFRFNINGSNLYPLLVKNFHQGNRKIFIIFSPNSNSNKIKINYKKYFNDSNGLVEYCIFNKNKTDKMVNLINSFKPDAVFIGIGQPDQEYWLLNNKDSINSNLLVCSGSGFEFLLSQKKRAPLYFQKLGLEWLYRLFQEPKRLWKRYILGIPVFIYYVLKQKFKLMFKKGNT